MLEFFEKSDGTLPARVNIWRTGTLEANVSARYLMESEPTGHLLPLNLKADSDGSSLAAEPNSERGSE